MLLLDFAEPLGLVDVILGNGNRHQQDDWLRLDVLAQVLDQHLGRAAALAAGELLDGRRKSAVADAGQGFGKCIEADDRDIDAPFLRNLK